MDVRLTDHTVRQLVERLSTNDPVPGGGSAAALAGAMAAALLHMVVELAGTEAADVDAQREIQASAVAWQSELLNLAELDANAYAAVVAAQRLPRETEIERQARQTQLAASLREATRAPLQTARLAGSVLQLAERLAPIATRHAVSDVGVAAALAAAAVRGASLTTRINLPHIHDEQLMGEARETIDTLAAGLAAREERVLNVVAERLG